jgi:ferritin
VCRLLNRHRVRYLLAGSVAANLHATAEKSKDRPATVMLQWFVTEQMEEEAAARAVLGRIRLAGNTGVGLLMVDQELAGGKVPGAPAEPPAGGQA